MVNNQEIGVPRIRTFAFSSNSLLFLSLLGSRENQTVGVTGKCGRTNQLHCSFIGLFFCLCLRLRQSDSDLFFYKIVSDRVMSKTASFAYDFLGLFFNYIISSVHQIKIRVAPNPTSTSLLMKTNLR